jgi:hypothetical protein
LHDNDNDDYSSHYNHDDNNKEGNERQPGSDDQFEPDRANAECWAEVERKVESRK